jgi:hypothetical protein
MRDHTWYNHIHIYEKNKYGKIIRVGVSETGAKWENWAVHYAEQ